MVSLSKIPIYKYSGDEYFDLVFLTKPEIKEMLLGGWYQVVLEEKQMICVVNSKEDIYKLKNMLEVLKIRGKSNKVQFTRFSKN